MNEDLISIIFFAAITILLVVKIKNILGREDFNHPEHKKAAIVPLPGTEKMKVVSKDVSDNNDASLIHSLDEVSKAQLENIYAKDAAFSLSEFMDGARGAFEMVMQAFARGNVALLENLLDVRLFKEYKVDIERREQLAYQLHHTLVALNDVQVHAVSLRGNKASVIVDFHSEQINFVVDKEGVVIEGDKSTVEEVHDRWTFTRDVTSDNPNWTLVDTDEI